MTQEEKAKRYDEVVNEIKNLRDMLLEEGVINEDGVICDNFNRIFPELKESEDEKIRKALINGVECCKASGWTNFGNNVDIDVVLAWLEKQGKKVEPIEGFNSEFERQISHLIASIINKEYEYTEAFVKWTSDALLNYAKHEIDKQVEQKSSWSEEDEKKRTLLINILEVNHPNGYFKVNPANTLNMEAMSTEELVSWLKFLKERVGCEANYITTKEWSEEDMKHFRRCLGYIEAYVEPRRDDVRWFKSLKDRVGCKVNCTTTRKWSEEDERMIRALISMCDVWATSHQFYPKENKEMETLKNWLKSLKPQNWTKEDKERYISCLQRLSTGNPDQPETINSKWFKEHVYPQPTWKPSKEQIKGIEYAIKTLQHQLNIGDNRLDSLYDDLKKLMKE